MNKTYIEQHYNFSVSEFEGLWEMTFRDPYNSIENVSVYVIAPNSIYQAEDYRDKVIVQAGPRLTSVLEKILYKIESYPFSWALSGKKIVSYGYDFETDFNSSSISYIDLTEIGLREVNEFYNFFSPLDERIVDVEEKVSGKGVLVKMDIDLNKPKHVNHLAIDFFTEYPIRMMTLMYQEDTKENSPFYEIPLSKMVESNDSIILHFSTVFAKRFRIIIQQESYTLQNKEISEAKVEASELWNYASANSRSIYVDSVNEYLEEIIMPTKSGIELHQDIIDKYKNAVNETPEKSDQPTNSYRESFSQQKQRLDKGQVYILNTILIYILL